jgi:hypothetical protein
MFYQNEMLATLRKQEIERNSREAWKFTSIKKESLIQKLSRMFTANGNKKSQTDNSRCLAC